MAYSSATSSRSPIRSLNLIAAVWICFLLANSSSLFVLAKGGPPNKLTFYVHEKRTPPASLIVVAPESGPQAEVKWGSVIVVDNDVRETNATDSTLLGRQLGSVVVGLDNVTMYTSSTFLLNTTAYEGSLTTGGLLQYGKLVVTGGTDTFSFVRGVASVKVFVDNATAGVYEYTVDLKY